MSSRADLASFLPSFLSFLLASFSQQKEHPSNPQPLHPKTNLEDSETSNDDSTNKNATNETTDLLFLPPPPPLPLATLELLSLPFATTATDLLTPPDQDQDQAKGRVGKTLLLLEANEDPSTVEMEV